MNGKTAKLIKRASHVLHMNPDAVKVITCGHDHRENGHNRKVMNNIVVRVLAARRAVIDDAKKSHE